jgi:hypothetical protein
VFPAQSAIQLVMGQVNPGFFSSPLISQGGIFVSIR